MMMMMRRSLKLALIFGAALGLYQYNTNNTDQLTTNSALQPDPQFDYFMFVLQWPAAFCNIQLKNNTTKRKCNPDPVLAKHQKRFTVHGLWPQLNGAKSPLSCREQDMPDNYLNDVQGDLLDYWPDLFSAANFEKSKKFWKREWNKHGTCSLEKFNPKQYLEITLDLAKKYAERIFGELQVQEIKPDGTTARRVEDIQEAVKRIVGHNPMINIVLNGTGDHLLLEIKLCVQSDGVTLFDCDPLYKFASPE